jgi:hypothetical protein
MLGLDLPVKVNHDRYAIYKMLGRKISFITHAGGRRKIIGVVEKVCRNIFDNMVEITIKGKLFKFKEPTVITQVSDSESVILFVYGKTPEEEEAQMSDKALFAEVRASFYKGETINDVISRTTPAKKKVVKFILANHK